MRMPIAPLIKLYSKRMRLHLGTPPAILCADLRDIVANAEHDRSIFLAG